MMWAAAGVAHVGPRPTPRSDCVAAMVGSDALALEHGMLARSALLRQACLARLAILKHQPDSVLTIGGGCLVDLAQSPVSASDMKGNWVCCGSMLMPMCGRGMVQSRGPCAFRHSGRAMGDSERAASASLVGKAAVVEAALDAEADYHCDRSNRFRTHRCIMDARKAALDLIDELR